MQIKNNQNIDKGMYRINKKDENLLFGAAEYYMEPYMKGYLEEKSFGSKRTRRSRSFGQPRNSQTPFYESKMFRQYIIIVVILLLRILVKGKPYKPKLITEVNGILAGVINGLAMASVIEFLSYLFGREFTEKIVIGYLTISIGMDIADVAGLT